MLSIFSSASDNNCSFVTMPQKSEEAKTFKDYSREVGESNEPVTFQFGRCVVRL